MRLPLINTVLSTRGNAIAQFGGLNQNVIANENEFAAMKNISDRFFPAIGTRPDRGNTEKQLSDPKAILYKNGLFYIDGDKAYYNDQQVFTVSISTSKQVVGMGAYICVFPDNILFNTHTGTVEQLNAHLSPSTVTTFAPLSDDSAYTKITTAGIGNTFHKADNVTISGCTNAQYNGTHVIINADTDYIIISGALDAAFTQASGLSFDRNIPTMDFVAERDNRLWGCSSANHEVYCCKAGDPKNWYNYEAGADQAWAATVGSDGDFTGIVKYSTYMMFFKESTVHILRGDKPSNFALTEKALSGVRRGCERSIVSINETLFYVSRDGVYAFNGAIPQKISYQITQPITDAVASTYDGKYYLSCKLDNKQTLLVYDPTVQLWDIEDDTQFKFAANSEGMLHYVGSDNGLKSIYAFTEAEHMPWFLETVDQTGGYLTSNAVNNGFNILDNKYISGIKLDVWLPAGSELFIYIKCDEDTIWRRKGYIRSTKNKTYKVPIRPHRCRKYRIRLEGRGHFRILGMTTQIEVGGEADGNLHFGYRH